MVPPHGRGSLEDHASRERTRGQHKGFKWSVPQDVGEATKKDTARPAIALRVRERAIRDEGDRIVHRLPKLTTEALTLTLIPVLDRYQVDLLRPTDKDGQRQRDRWSRRVLTSDHEP